MGSNSFYPDEAPKRDVFVDPFSISIGATTNSQFSDFVEDTGYVTTAEVPFELENFIAGSKERYITGSLVFQKTSGPVDLRDFRNWWKFVPGANWRIPEGPGSTIMGRLDHPVVHVSLIDALAYATWAGQKLPTEREWEFAARGGADTEFPWGDELCPGEEIRANTWHGKFPYQNDRVKKGPLTMPSLSLAPSRYGLFNMIGNVWEWTTDKYRTALEEIPSCCSGERLESSDIYVVKGGSFLCEASYCQRYRPAARSPQEIRSSTNHLGFRCVKRT